MDIMTHFIKRNNIDVPYFARKEGRENFVDPHGNYHNVQFTCNDGHALIPKVKYFPHVFEFYTYSDIL